MERALRDVVVALCCGLLGIGAVCGESDTERDGGTPSAEFVATAEQAARDTVLTPSDVPSDWRSEPDEPADDGESVDLSPDCEYLEQDAFAGQLARAEGDALIGPAHEINTSASVLPSDDEAHETLQKWFRTVLDCRDEIAEYTRRDPRYLPDDRLDYEELDVPHAGDEALAIRITFTSRGRPGVVDFVHVRQGRIIAILAHGGAVADDAQRDHYVSLLAEKARAADERLPD